MKIVNLTQVNRIAAFVAVSFISTWTAQGAFVAPNTDPIGTLLTDSPLAAPGGTVLATLESPFFNVSDPGISGILRSIAVQTAGPGSALDFYYQVVNTSTATPAFELFTFAIQEGYRSAIGSIDAYYLTTPTGLAGLPFADVAGTAGKTVHSAYRVSSTDSAGFVFDSGFTAPDAGGAGGATNENIEPGQTSNWLVFRTALTQLSTDAGYSLAAIASGSGSADALALTPIPEPSTVLFGLAMFGVCAGGRFRKKLAA